MQVTKVDSALAFDAPSAAIPATQQGGSLPMQEAFSNYQSAGAQEVGRKHGKREESSAPTLMNTCMSEQDGHPANFRIVESQLPLLKGVAGHNMLVLLNGAGQVCRETEGLATGSDGKIKPIGYLPSDRLKVYAFDRPYLYRPNQAHACLIEGSRTDLENRMNAALAAGAELNKRNVPYPFLGLGKNSNSVASTLVRVMGLNEPSRLPGGAWFMPGQGGMVLDDDTIAGIQTKFHIDPGVKETLAIGTQLAA